MLVYLSSMENTSESPETFPVFSEMVLRYIQKPNGLFLRADIFSKLQTLKLHFPNFCNNLSNGKIFFLNHFFFLFVCLVKSILWLKHLGLWEPNLVSPFCVFIWGLICVMFLHQNNSTTAVIKLYFTSHLLIFCVWIANFSVLFLMCLSMARTIWCSM